MDRKSARFKVKRHIVGGGLCLREGEVVDEQNLRGYAKLLEREGGIERLPEQVTHTGGHSRHG